MTNTISLDDWLTILDEEYLSTFVREGGSAVKFVIVNEEEKSKLQDRIRNCCETADYLFVTLDAGFDRAHMPQDLFFSLANQVDWRFLARCVILRLLEKNGFNTRDIDPNGAGNVIDAIVVANGSSRDYAIHALRPILADSIFRNSDLVKAFRDAMDHLCWIEALEPAQTDDYRGQPILNWLTGRVSGIGPLRDFHIRTRIDRTTARYFMESASHWIRQAGYEGLVVFLDNTRVTVAKNPKDGIRYYTRAMTVDHYEMLREFIDEVDRLCGTLLVVAPGYGFLDDNAKGRGWGCYEALRTRIMDDVRDRNIANPASVLVRIS